MRYSSLVIVFLTVLMAMETNGILLFYRNYNSKNPFDIQQLREQQKLKNERLAYEMAQEEKLRKIKSKLTGEKLLYFLISILIQIVFAGLVSKMFKELNPKVNYTQRKFLELMLNNRGWSVLKIRVCFALVVCFAFVSYRDFSGRSHVSE